MINPNAMIYNTPFGGYVSSTQNTQNANGSQSMFSSNFRNGVSNLTSSVSTYVPGATDLSTNLRAAQFNGPEFPQILGAGNETNLFTTLNPYPLSGGPYGSVPGSSLLAPTSFYDTPQPYSSPYDSNPYSANSSPYQSSPYGNSSNPYSAAPYSSNPYSASPYSSVPPMYTGPSAPIYSPPASSTPASSDSSDSGSDPSSLLLLLLVSLLEKGSNDTSTPTTTTTTVASTPTPTPTPANTPSGDSAGDTTVWGDPHFTDSNNNTIDDQIATDTTTQLIKTADGAFINGLTGTYNNPNLATKEGTGITVFTETAINLGDGTKIEFDADGTAYHVNADGTKGAALTDGEKVTSSTNPNNSVTYDATDKQLKFDFVDADGNKIKGNMQANIDANGNYINTSITNSTGESFAGMLPALKTNFSGLTVDPITGLGAFTAGADGTARSNADFVTNTLWSANDADEKAAKKQANQASATADTSTTASGTTNTDDGTTGVQP